VPYSILKRDGKRAAALYEMAPEQGAFPYWASYVRVMDVQASAEQAVELGGRLVMPAVDVMQLGRMAFIQDPTGPCSASGSRARCSVPSWTIPTAHGAGASCRPADTKAAARFYEDLFRLDRTDQQEPDGRALHLFELDGKEVGGMLELDAEWGSMPPNWSVYFGVEDCDGTWRRPSGSAAASSWTRWRSRMSGDSPSSAIPRAPSSPSSSIKSRLVGVWNVDTGSRFAGPAARRGRDLSIKISSVFPEPRRLRHR
jgi:predicted enzyme related to lactoylglutathione lyase